MMSVDKPPHLIIADLAASFQARSDAEVLAAIDALPPLLDETDSQWDSDEYWVSVAYPYLALADVAAQRRLLDAIRPLLDRACYGDPGEIMRGLRCSFEAIVKPDWSALADICLAAARSSRPGTRLWAIDELTVLEDQRARPIFEEAARDGSQWFRDVGEMGLRRLAAAG
jgi:hypothetical protein